MGDQEQIIQVLYEWIKVSLVENDVEKMVSYLTDDLVGIGLGEQGIVTCKQDARQVMELGAKNDDSAEYEVSFEHPEVRCHTADCASICTTIKVKRIYGTEISYSGLMQSATLRREAGEWKICAIHATPIALTEESIDAYPFKFAENSLAQLKADLQTETFDLMNRSIPGGILSYYVYENGCPLYFINDSMLAYLGYTRKEFTEKYQDNIVELFHPNEREMMLAIAADVAVGNKDHEVCHRILKKDGSSLWMMDRGRKGNDENGAVVLLSVYVDVTEMVNLQRELELRTKELEEQTKTLTINEERFRVALEKTANIIFDYDIISGNIMHSSTPKKPLDFVTNISEAKQTLIIGGEITDECMDEFNQAFRRIQNGEHQAECVITATLATGKKIWNRISMTGICDTSGRAVRAIGIIEDITKQKEAEIAYIREEQYRQAILSDALASYIINYTKGDFESCRVNHPYCVVAQPGEPYDDFIVQTSQLQLSEEDRRDYINLFSRVSVMDAFRKGQNELQIEYRLFNRDGTVIWMQTTMRLMLDAATNEVKGFMYVSDINKRKQEELELTLKLETDQLTGVYNKGAAESRIMEKLKTVAGLQTGVFMMLDIDRFKEINDTYGHPFGDKILTDVAKVLKDNFRETDVVGRLGGDEFCIFFSGMSSLIRVEQSAQAICQGVRHILTKEIGKPGFSCSIGIAMCAGIAKSFEQIYQEADSALYKVKANGRNGYAFFEKKVSDMVSVR